MPPLMPMPPHLGQLTIRVIIDLDDILTPAFNEVQNIRAKTNLDNILKYVLKGDNEILKFKILTM